MRALLSAIMILGLGLEVCSDSPIFQFRLAQKYFKKDKETQDKELNEAIKTKLDEYFSTVDPIDVKYNIPRTEVNDMKTTYKVGDADKDGKLTLAEMRGLVNVNHALTEDELKELLKNADTNNDSKLSMEELAGYIARTELGDKKADLDRDEFESMDLNKDKNIDVGELQRLYRFCNQNFNRQLINKIITVGDQDNNKELNYEELSGLLKSKDVLSAGEQGRPSEKTSERIKQCIENFINKCKGGKCNQPLRPTAGGMLRELFKLPTYIKKSIRDRQ